MYTTSWKEGREKAELPFVRIHDLKHTFRRRLRSAGVSFEDRQDLLGNKSGRITTNYSEPELINLMPAAERVCSRKGPKLTTLVTLRKKIPLHIVGNRAG
jgi:integrase